MIKEIIKRFRKGFSSEGRKGYGENWRSFMPTGSDVVNGVYKSYSYACINARAENIAKARIYLKKRNGEGYDDVYSHGFLDIINKPNNFNQSFEMLLYMVSASLDIHGNALLLIKRGKREESLGSEIKPGRINSRKPEGLYYMPYENIRMIMNKENSRIESYEYREGNNVYMIPERDVIHFLVPSPGSNIKGKPISAAFNFTLDIDYYQNLFQRSFYINNASIGLILENEEQMVDEQLERIETRLQQKFTGVEKSGKPLILEGGLKASSYKPSVKDVEMLPSRKMIRDEILAIYRVPKVILGILEDVNYAGSKEAYRIFNEYTIKPFAKICIESKLNIFLQENYEEVLKLTMEYEFETDRALQLKAFEVYRKYDIASIDEIREIEGFGKRRSKN